MAVLDGQIAGSALGGSENSHLTPAMQLFGLDYWPTHESQIVGSPLGALITHWPVAANGTAKAGQRAGSYSDDYYHGIHISTTRISLGNIVSEQVAVLRIWNAYFSPLGLVSLSGLTEGISVTGPQSPPFTWPALLEQDWLVGVQPDGPSVVDTELTWLFNNGDSTGVLVTGNRIIAWAWQADWAEGITERLTWATDVLQSLRGTEQRRALRLSPRREFEEQFLVEGRERQLLDLYLFGWSDRTWAVPIRADVQRLQVAIAPEALHIPCDTADRDFAEGGMVLLRGETALDVEVAQVDAVTPTGVDLVRPTQNGWERGTWIYPARPARLAEQPDIVRVTDNLDRLQVRFELADPNDWPAAMPATEYRGWPVLEERPNEADDLTHAVSRLLLLLDNRTGNARQTDTADRLFASRMHRWLLDGREQRARFRSLLYALQGRLKALWLPTHAMDLTLATDIGAGLTIDVAAIGYTRFAGGEAGRRDIRIELRDGTAIHRRIIGSSQINKDVERLTLDAAIDADIERRQVLRISWLLLCRLDHDAVELHHLTDAAGVATSQVVFKEVRDDDDI